MRRTVTAGEALPADLQRRFSERFGHPVLDGIGSTEALHIFLSNTQGRRAARHQRHAGARATTCGSSTTPARRRRARHARATCRSAGPSLATGYWCRDAATRAAFQGEWLATGDVYTRSADGYWTFLGRNSDMIKAGGIWVSPAEVEGVLVEHPDVLEAAVVGARDADGLEITVAFVVARQGRTIDDGADRRPLPSPDGGVQAAAAGRRRRRAAEDGDRQDPPLRPARPAGGRAGRRRTGRPRRGSTASTSATGACLVDADDRLPTCHRSCSSTRGSARSGCGAGSPITSRAAVGGPSTLVYSRARLRPQRAGAPAATGRPTCTTRPTSCCRRCSTRSASSGRSSSATATARRSPCCTPAPAIRSPGSCCWRRTCSSRTSASPPSPPPATAYDTTDLRERLARHHDDVDATFRGWNDVWLSPAFRSWNIEDRLPAITCPVLVVQGDDDPYGTTRPARRHRARASPGRSSGVVLPGVGHAPHLEAPEATLDAIADFVNWFDASRR